MWTVGWRPNVADWGDGISVYCSAGLVSAVDVLDIASKSPLVLTRLNQEHTLRQWYKVWVSLLAWLEVCHAVWVAGNGMRCRQLDKLQTYQTTDQHQEPAEEMLQCVIGSALCVPVVIRCYNWLLHHVQKMLMLSCSHNVELLQPLTRNLIPISSVMLCSGEGNLDLAESNDCLLLGLWLCNLRVMGGLVA